MKSEKDGRFERYFLEAVKYQIVVMLMIAAAVAIGCLILIVTSYKRFFDSEGALHI